jgi:hypothetical protein
MPAHRTRRLRIAAAAAVVMLVAVVVDMKAAADASNRLLPHQSADEPRSGGA